MTGAIATTANEEPIFFAADGESLFGIITHPTVDPLGVGLVILGGGANAISPNRNRLSVRLCRRVAAMGFHAARFDYHGVGESTGAVRRVRLHDPPVQDVLAAVASLRERGVRRFVLIGSCAGSRAALASARFVDELDGLIFVAWPLQDIELGDRAATTAARDWGPREYLARVLTMGTLRGLFDRKKRTIYARFIRRKVQAILARTPLSRERHPLPEGFSSQRVLNQFGGVVDRKVPIAILYGEDDEFFHEFAHDRKARLRELLERGGDDIEVRMTTGKVHGFRRVRVQDWTIDQVCDWLGDRLGSRREATEARVAR